MILKENDIKKILFAWFEEKGLKFDKCDFDVKENYTYPSNSFDITVELTSEEE